MRHPFVDRTALPLVVASSLWAVPVGASSLRDLAARIDAPSVGRQVTLVQPLRVGRAVFTPDPGTRVYLLLAGEQPCGLLIDGRARFTYVVDDRFSVPVARRNLRRASSLSAVEKDAGLEVADSVEGAVLWGWELSSQASAPAASEGQAVLPAWAVELRDQSLVSPPSQELLTAHRLEVRDVVYALLRTARDRLLLNVDPLEGRSEALYALRKASREATLSELYRARLLVEQPIGRQWWDRFAAPLVSEEETIEVDNDRERHVTVSATLRLRATRARVALWRTRLIANVFDNTKPLPVMIKSVQVEGKPAEWVRHRSDLLIALPRPLASGQTVQLQVVSEGEMAVRPGGDNFWSLGTAAWYPRSSLNGQLARIDLTVRVPDPFIPFASGAVIKRETKEGYNVVHTRLDRPMQFPVVAAGRYHVLSDTVGGVTAHVASYAFKNDRASRRLINNFFAAAQYYEKLFGVPYPFKDFSVVEINSWGFGQAPPGIIFITSEAYNPLATLQTEGLEGVTQGVNSRYVHEIAHGWWGHVVKMDSAEEQWLTESFAQYAAALCLQAMRDPRGKSEFQSALNRWKAYASDIGQGGSIYLANGLAGEEGDFRDRVFLLYFKGPLVLHALRQELARRKGSAEEGDRYFFALLRSFLKTFDHKWGSTRHLVGILDQMTGGDWQPWFERYVYGTETPKVN